jgi:hypothetical protein
VTGTWSGGRDGADTCTTGANGRCQVVSGLLRNHESVTFSVTKAVRASYPYQPSKNHDPDGDSDGTSISVAKP